MRWRFWNHPSALARCLRQLWRGEVTGQRCLSQVHHQAINLTGEYAADAEQVSIAFTVKWPILRLAWRPPALAFELLDPAQVPVVDPGRCTIQQTVHFRTTRVCLTLPGESCRQHPSVRSLGRRCKDGRGIADIVCRRLDVASVVRELKTTRCDLFVLEKGERMVCERFHDQLEQVGFAISVELSDSEHRSFLNQLGIALDVELWAASRGGASLNTWRHPLYFKSREHDWEQRMGTAASRFERGPGGYGLRFHLGPHEIAARKFQVVAHESCLAEARHHVREKASVEDVAVSTVNHRGVSVPAQVVAEDFRQLDVSFVLNSPRPDALVAEAELRLLITVESVRNSSIVYSQEHPLTLREGRHSVGRPVPISAALFAAGPGRFQVAVFLDNRPLTQLEFTHQTRAQIRAEKAEAIWQSLRLTDAHLFTVRDGQQVETDHVFETDAALVPVFTIQGSGFDEDAPVLKWRLTVTFTNLDSGSVATEHRWLHTKEGANLHPDQEFPIGKPRRELGPSRYRLELLKRNQLLAECQFRILSSDEIVPYTTKLIVNSLRAEEARLFIQTGEVRYESPFVPDSSDFLLPELTLHATGFNSHLPRLKTQLQLRLIESGAAGRDLISFPVTLTPKSQRVRNLAIRLRDTTLAENPGRGELAVMVAAKEIGRIPFQVVGADEILRQLAVTTVTVEATSNSGKRLPNLSRLQPGGLRSFRVTIEFAVGLLAPNVVVDASALLWLEGSVRGQADFSVRLNQRNPRITSRPIPATILPAHPGAEAGQLTIEICIGDERLAARSFELLADRITDFEGKLTMDPHRLEVDEDEYRAILSGLRT